MAINYLYTILQVKLEKTSVAIDKKLLPSLCRGKFYYKSGYENILTHKSIVQQNFSNNEYMYIAHFIWQ